MLALGDIYYPFINNGVGGGIDRMIRWLNASCIIPGHGPIGNRAQLVKFRDMLMAIRENVARLKQQGKSIEVGSALSSMDHCSTG